MALARFPFGAFLGCMLVCGGMLLGLGVGWSFWRGPVLPGHDAREESGKDSRDMTLLEEMAQISAVTDLGHRIRLYQPRSLSSARARAKQLASENRRMVEEDFLGRVLRTAEPDDQYDCHGWVFADGLGWITGDDVEQILRENGYQAVAEPEVEDLVIYRDRMLGIIHSAIVLDVDSDERALVESKWGLGSRFVHLADTFACKGSHLYYRSARSGHRLKGLFSNHPRRS